MKSLIIVFLFSFVIKLNAMNWYPLPDNIIKNFQVIPFYGVTYFNDLSLAASGGEVDEIQNSLGVRLKWGNPFSGLSVQYEHINSYVSTGELTTFSETKLNLDIYKLRYFKPVIDDEFSQISLFASIGKLSGGYDVTNSIEDQGITGYVVRSINATIGDFGASFIYKLNPDWCIFFEAGYQLSLDEKITNLAGVEVSQTGIDFTGAMINLGTSFRL
ncbi:MAG: hypothetical protein VXX85_06035 [Candidatus Margulisiibacteriota bacterium]|nr:hypothetical protein [Candidatus Margulisiibacteriota bacterium]